MVKNLHKISYIHLKNNTILLFAVSDKDMEFFELMDKVKDLNKYKEDKAQCMKMASSIDLTSEAATKALAGGAAGGVAVAGVATAVAGAVFLPAMPFIAAGTALGSGAMGYSVKAKARKKRDLILGQCLRDRGYIAYTGE